MRKVYPGWRFFKCDNCGTHWKESCRDSHTPSISNCINTDCFTTHASYKNEIDLNIKTDDNGNLIEHTTVKFND